MVDKDAGVAALSRSLAISASVAFRAPAFIRAKQWGVVGMTPDGMPIGAGDYWLLSDDEAANLGSAWAELIVLYMPEEYIERGAVLSTALMVTAGTLIPRIMMDADAITMHKAAEEVTAENERRARAMGAPPDVEKSA